MADKDTDDVVIDPIVIVIVYHYDMPDNKAAYIFSDKDHRLFKDIMEDAKNDAKRIVHVYECQTMGMYNAWFVNGPNIN